MQHPTRDPLLPQACQHARFHRTRALTRRQPTHHAASGERRPEMYLQSKLRPVELECGRVHHAAPYSRPTPSSSMPACKIAPSNVSQHIMLRQVKEDRRCIFKASSDLLSLNAEEFIMQHPTRDPLLPQACQRARLHRARALTRQRQPTHHAASGERRPEMYLQSKLRPVELECGRVHHAATYSTNLLHARLHRTRALTRQRQPTHHAASGERRPEMYLQSKLRPVELECGRVHHAAAEAHSFLKHASVQDCTEQRKPTHHAASGERRPEMYLQSKLRPVELECGRVHHAAAETHSFLKHASNRAWNGTPKFCRL